MQVQSIRFITLVLIVFFLVGCTMGDGISTPGPASGPFPEGEFKSMQFTFKIIDNDEHVLIPIDDTTGGFQGKHIVTGDQIQFTHEYCGAEIGIYKWRFEDDTLYFEMIKDDCFDRVDANRFGWKR